MHLMKIILVIIFSLLVPAISLTAQTKPTVVIPDTPAGIQLKSWLRVFAAGDDQAFQRFISEHYSKACSPTTMPPIEPIEPQGLNSIPAASTFATLKNPPTTRSLYWRNHH